MGNVGGIYYINFYRNSIYLDYSDYYFDKELIFRDVTEGGVSLFCNKNFAGFAADCLRCHLF